VSGKPTGTHKFLSWVVCNACGHKHDWGSAGFTAMYAHIRKEHRD
jgi:hypothetical protein